MNKISPRKEVQKEYYYYQNQPQQPNPYYQNQDQIQYYNEQRDYQQQQQQQQEQVQPNYYSNTQSKQLSNTYYPQQSPYYPQQSPYFNPNYWSYYKSTFSPRVANDKKLNIGFIEKRKQFKSEDVCKIGLISTFDLTIEGVFFIVIEYENYSKNVSPLFVIDRKKMEKIIPITARKNKTVNYLCVFLIPDFNHKTKNKIVDLNLSICYNKAGNILSEKREKAIIYC